MMDDTRKGTIRALLKAPPFGFGDIDDLSLELYNSALTQSTFANERRQIGISTEHYERLEFLGNYVLNLIIAEKLYRDSSNAEGLMTGKLSNLAENLALPSILSKYPQIVMAINMGGQPVVDKIKADVLEALIGATFISFGYNSAREVALKMFDNALDNFTPVTDYKSRLQMFVQDKFHRPETKKILKYDKPKTVEPDGLWHTTVWVNNQEWGTGKGKKRQDAEKDAAKNAFETHCN